jgi:hypothetical protein
MRKSDFTRHTQQASTWALRKSLLPRFVFVRSDQKKKSP